VAGSASSSWKHQIERPCPGYRCRHPFVCALTFISVGDTL
jgi:hypothetical protein